MAKYKLPVDKNTIASELGVQLGGERTARQNGSVGGEMVRRTFESFGRSKQIQSYIEKKTSFTKPGLFPLSHVDIKIYPTPIRQEREEG